MDGERMDGENKKIKPKNKIFPDIPERPDRRTTQQTHVCISSLKRAVAPDNFCRRGASTARFATCAKHAMATSTPKSSS